MKKISVLCALCSVLFLSACGGTKVVDLDDKSAVADMNDVMELEYRDWTKTAGHMVDSMVKSGAFRQIKNPVIAVGRVTNDTMQRFDTDILVKKIRTELVNSGRAQVTTAMRTTGAAEDEITHQTRELRGNAEYDASTIVGGGTLVAANMSLTGKMIQRNLHVETCWLCAHQERVEYYLQMTLTDVKTGLSVWEDEQPIIKEGRNAPKW